MCDMCDWATYKPFRLNNKTRDGAARLLDSLILDYLIVFQAPAHYEFSYSVEDPHTGDHKSHRESREGDVVKGEYSLLQPDGSIRKVEYTADDHNG